jgi:UDP-glucose 4-epimerase
LPEVGEVVLRLLVTGGSGFIGSVLVHRLLREGYDVTVFDLSPPQVHNAEAESMAGRLTFFRGDVTKISDLQTAAVDATYVVHLAAISSVPYSVSFPTETLQVNVIGTANALKASVDNNARGFILASSSAVYGEALSLPVKEDHVLQAMSPYGASKIAAEYCCHAFRESYGLPTLSLRLFNVYGGTANAMHAEGVVNKFVARLFAGKPLIIHGDGRQTRDFVHVDDVASAIIRIIDRFPTQETYNFGTGNSISMNELAKHISLIFGRDSPNLTYDQARPSEIRHSRADMSRWINATQYAPRITLDEGLKGLVDVEDSENASTMNVPPTHLETAPCAPSTTGGSKSR